MPFVTEPATYPQPRRAILDLIKRRGPQTVADLRDVLGISGVAVRRHLAALERDGLVDQSTRPSGRGRPAYVYTLTEAGQDLFPRNYHLLVEQVLDAVGDRFGPDAVEQLFAHREQALATTYASRTTGRALPELAQALAAIQDENGYMAECGPAGEGEYRVAEHNCAIARVASAYPAACAHELALFRRLAGPEVTVERIAHMQAGDPVCAYRLRSRGAAPDPARPATPRPGAGRAP